MMKQRIYKNECLKHPLIDEIYTRYASAFTFALEFSHSYFSNSELASIDKDEFGYLAVYFAASLEKQAGWKKQTIRKLGVICGTGGGSSYLLKVQLEKLFEHAEINTFAFNEWQSTDEEYDLIVSTIPQSFETNVPVVQVSPLLTETELVKIEQTLSVIDPHEKKFTDLQQSLLALFYEDTFLVVEKENRSYREFLKERAERMEQKGYAEPGYGDSVIERETLIDTIYKNGVAGPHPLEAKAIRECVDVILFRENCLSEEKQVTIVFLINIGKDHLRLHQEISRLLLKLMDQKLQQKLKKVTHFSEFMQHIQSFIKE